MTHSFTPDPNCRKCKGDGKARGLDRIWGGICPCGVVSLLVPGKPDEKVMPENACAVGPIIV